ncbi:DUF1615 domain-containing protein [Pseudoxanthomonas sp. NC8]|nr:DUF1615 domain-containing protein [Pseudoxanthomonas sp. NC8]
MTPSVLRSGGAIAGTAGQAPRQPWPSFLHAAASVPPLLLLLLLAGCATAPREAVPPPPDVHAQIVRRLPASVPDRAGWAADIEASLAAQRIAPTPENLCAVLAVTAQESGFVANPAVPDLPRIARAEIDRRADALHVPGFLVDAALKLPSPDGRSYAERLRAARTERDLSELYEDMTGSVPLGRRLFAGKNPVQTGGPMQVSIPFAESHASGYPWPIAGSVRDEVLTRRGGLYFGIAHLLGYDTPYTRKVHRFADYNAGWYASRNAAFQNAVAVASGIPLALDGDLLAPGAPLDRPGQTERAVRALAAQLDMDARGIRNQLERGDRLDFDDTALHARVFALAEAKSGQPLPRAMLPGIRLESPKITRELTTAWFAQRVDERYQQCMRQ